MRIDQTNLPYKLASDVAEIIKTLRITPHCVTKISPFEAHMGRKPNTPSSNIATNSSPHNLNWENAKHAFLDRKNLEQPPLPAEVMHDLERWSEDEVQIRKKVTPQKVPHKSIPRTLENKHPSPQPETSAYTKSIELAKNKFNVRYKGVQRTVDKNIKKRLEQVARKTIRLATKVKNPKTFKQKYKTIDGKILTYEPHTAWVQSFGKQPRLLRNSGTAVVPSPVIYGPCRPSRLSDYVAYKSTRRTGPSLRFLDINDPQAPQHSMFKEHTRTGLPVKISNQEKSQGQGTSKTSPTKRKALGKRTGGKPTRNLQTLRGMSLQTETEKTNNPEKEDDLSSISEEKTSPHRSDKTKKQHRLESQQGSQQGPDRRL